MNALGFYPLGAMRVLSDGSTVIGSDPLVYMRYSDDGAETFSQSLYRSMGAAGQRKTRLRWERGGTARDRVFQAGGDAPVKIAITTAWLEAEELAS
jgi:hypothetical protein